MPSSEPHRKYDILQTCSELLESLTPADQRMILAALIEQFGRPEQGRPATRPSPASTRRRSRGKWESS